MSCTMCLTCTARCRPSSAPWLPQASCLRPWRDGPMPWPSSAGIALTCLAIRFLSIPPKTVRPPWPGWEQPTIQRMSITSWFSQMLKIIACVWVGSCWEMIFTPSRDRRCCSASTHTRMPDRSLCNSCTSTSTRRTPLRKKGDPMDLYTFLKRLPKVSLHMHLAGSVQPSTLVELASKNGVALPAYRVPADLYDYPDIYQFLTMLDLVMASVRGRAD